MSDATLETVDGRPALRFERALPHPVERVWPAISMPAELRQWFPAAGDWGPTTGETFEAYGVTGQVLEAAPPHRLAWTFAGDAYSFQLTADGDGCRLVFLHVFDDRAMAAQTAAGWDTYLARLEPHLEGGHLSEADAHRGWAELHERYAASFGVDPTPGRQFLAAMRGGQ